MTYSILLLMRNRLFTVISQWPSQRNSTEKNIQEIHTYRQKEGRREM